MRETNWGRKAPAIWTSHIHRAHGRNLDVRHAWSRTRFIRTIRINLVSIQEQELAHQIFSETGRPTRRVFGDRHLPTGNVLRKLLQICFLVLLHIRFLVVIFCVIIGIVLRIGDERSSMRTLLRKLGSTNFSSLNLHQNHHRVSRNYKG